MVSTYAYSTRRDMHNTAEPDSCTGAAPPPGARRFTSRIILLAPVLACARGQLLSPARHLAGGVQAGGRHEIAPDGREQLVELLGEQRVAEQPRRRAHLCGRQ